MLDHGILLKKQITIELEIYYRPGLKVILQQGSHLAPF